MKVIDSTHATIGEPTKTQVPVALRGTANREEGPT